MTKKINSLWSFFYSCELKWVNIELTYTRPRPKALPCCSSKWKWDSPKTRRCMGHCPEASDSEEVDTIYFKQTNTKKIPAFKMFTFCYFNFLFLMTLVHTNKGKKMHPRIPAFHYINLMGKKITHFQSSSLSRISVLIHSIPPYSGVVSIISDIKWITRNVEESKLLF